MKKIIYPLLLIALGAVQGCNEFLGNKPKGDMIPETFDDYVKLMAEQGLSRGGEYGRFLPDR